MGQEQLKSLIWKVLQLTFVLLLVTSSIIYLNSRWEKIRDIKRQVDTQSIIKALDFYNIQFGQYPNNLDDDGDGWDKSNDKENRTFLEPLVKVGLFSSLIFDPKNDELHYYRYQRFAAGDFNCPRPFAVFQITAFETKSDNIGNGSCPGFDWTELAPNGFTWFSLD